MKYYAVRVGKAPGIYYTWDDAKKMVEGVTGAEFKSFKSLQDAQNYLNGNVTEEDKFVLTTGDYAFVEGICSGTDYGYGAYVKINGIVTKLYKKGSDTEMASMRTIAGDLLGVVSVLQFAMKSHSKSITIYYNSEGIEKWVTGAWSAKNIYTQKYAEYIRRCYSKINIQFIRVNNLKGISAKDEAIALAKRSLLV